MARWFVYGFVGLVGILIIKGFVLLYSNIETSAVQYELNENLKKSERQNISKAIYDKNFDSLIKLGQYQKAISISELRMKKYPDEKAFITRSIGYIYYWQGDIDTAIVKFTEAINLRESYVGAYVDRGLLYMEIDSFDLAITDFEFAANVNYDFYLNLGLAQEKKGLLGCAINSYDKYLENYPENISWKLRRDSLTLLLKNQSVKTPTLCRPKINTNGLLVE